MRLPRHPENLLYNDLMNIGEMDSDEDDEVAQWTDRWLQDSEAERLAYGLSVLYSDQPVSPYEPEDAFWYAPIPRK